VPISLQSLFRSDDVERNKFLSRLFGIFSEEIVRCWTNDNQAPYQNLGRPTIRPKGSQQRGTVLDFPLKSKTDGQIYITEMKCWMEYEKHSFLTPEDPAQVKKARKFTKGFPVFLDVAKSPSQFTLTVGTTPQTFLQDRTRKCCVRLTLKYWSSAASSSSSGKRERSPSHVPGFPVLVSLSHAHIVGFRLRSCTEWNGICSWI
jgi:hypothetical protein